MIILLWQYKKVGPSQVGEKQTSSSVRMQRPLTHWGEMNARIQKKTNKYKHIYIQFSLFIFSFRIYESKDFLWDKVTVFHSLFLSTCEKRQSVRSVSIGHYVLPPVSVQHGKDYSRFIDLLWDTVNLEERTLSHWFLYAA